MARTITITFEGGTSHTYRNVPDAVTREEVAARAAREFSSMRVVGIELLRPGATAGEIPQAQPPEGYSPARHDDARPASGGVLRGVAEAGAALVTAPVGAVVGAGRAAGTLAAQIMAGEFGSADAAREVATAMIEGAASATYAPRTSEGQAIVGAIGEVGAGLAPLTPLIGPASQGAALAGAAARQASAAAPAVATAARDAAGKLATTARAAVAPAAPAAAGGSVGAAGVDLAALRTGLANELPVPIQLTRGQRARTYAEQQAEQVLASDPKIGDPIRQRYNDQRQQLAQNLDAFFDGTDARLTELRDVGVAVDKTLRSSLAKEKQRVRVLYKEAEKAGELEAPVTLEGVAKFFNDNTAEAQVANVIGASRQKAINLGLIAEQADGTVVARPTTLAQGELFRRSVGGLTNAEPTNIKFGADLKRIYDEGTEAAAAAINERKTLQAARADLDEWIESGSVGKDGSPRIDAALDSAPKLAEQATVWRAHWQALTPEQLSGDAPIILRNRTSTSASYNGLLKGVIEPNEEGGNIPKHILQIKLPAGASYGRRIRHSDPGHPEILQEEFLLRKGVELRVVAQKNGVVVLEASAPDASQPKAGSLYAKARAARREMGDAFERNELTRNLIGSKRGTADRAVAFEDVLQRTVLSPASSLDSLRHVGQLIKKSGPEGQQTWRELQGATIRHLQERALGNVARDERGTPIFSVAKFNGDIKALDRNGKLEYMFGKRGAEQLRTLNDVAKVVFNPLPGTVNTSNTATTLAAMIDLLTAAGTGVPMPAVTGFKLIRDQVKDRKLRARVAAHLT